MMTELTGRIEELRERNGPWQETIIIDAWEALPEWDGLRSFDIVINCLPGTILKEGFKLGDRVKVTVEPLIDKGLPVAELATDNLTCGDCRFIRSGEGLQKAPPLNTTGSYHCRKTGLRIDRKTPACPDIARSKEAKQ